MSDISFDQLLHDYLEVHGGVVIARLEVSLKHFQPEAPELADADTLKEYIASKPDEYKIQVSSTGVERAKLAASRPIRDGPLASTLNTLQEAKAQDPDSACDANELYDAALKEKQSDGDAPVPFYLTSKDEFLRALRSNRRVRRKDDKVFLLPRRRSPSPGKRRSASRAPATNGQNGRSRSARSSVSPDPPRHRPQATPVEPKDLELAPDVNNATLICSLAYEQLCERGATTIDTGLPVKVLLRFVSTAFHEARPDASHESMSSLRIFKLLIAQLPGLKRQRPRRRVRKPKKGPPPPIEPVIWFEDEDALVAGIKAGIDDEVKVEVLENADAIAAGEPQEITVQEQENWKTSVVGPTAEVAVLDKFFADNADQAVWGFETEHRVGLGVRRPAGKLALIIVSDMQHTLIWDAHQGGIPETLARFLANDQIFKGGVKIAPKASKLLSQYGVATNKFVELSKIATDLGLLSEEEKERVNMRVMTQNVLTHPIARPVGIRDSNWELRPLTPRQYIYAVEDGYASALLFMHMVAQLHKNNQGAKLNEACIPALSNK